MTTTGGPKRVLGVDPGLQRTGLSLSDPLGISVRGLPNLIPRSRAEDVATLIALAIEHEVEAVVIGHPVLPRSGDEGPMGKRARGFAEALARALAERRLDVAVHLVNEVGTSKAAAARLVEAGVKKSKRRARLDSEAACLIVEAFLAGDRGTLVAAKAD